MRDAPGTANDRTIRYSLDDHAYEIVTGNGQRTRYWYGPDGQRYQREDADGTRTLYIGQVEVLQRGATTCYRRNLGGVLVRTEQGSTAEDRFVFTDRLGSVVKYTDGNGTVYQPQDYDGWGQRRSTADPTQAGTAPTPPIALRGYSGHEMVDGQDVIHMNARLYDRILGRFLQADPLIQAPENLQSWNAYTYVLNNPLTLVDPTGMFSWRKFLSIVGQVLNVVSYFFPALKPFAMAFNIVLGAVNGGIKGGLLAAFGAMLPGFKEVAGIWDTVGNIAIGAAYGGLSAVAMGGRFREGVIGSLKSAAIGLVLNAIAQGTKSEQTGGKYKSGADTETAKEALVTSGTICGPEPENATWDLPNRNEKWADKLTTTTRADGVVVIRGELTVSGPNAEALAKLTNAAWYGAEGTYNGVVYRSEIHLTAVEADGDWQSSYLSAKQVHALNTTITNHYSSGIVGAMNFLGESDLTLSPAKANWTTNNSIPHEFGHALGITHAPNASGSITSYACGRAVTGKDLYLIANAYRN